MGASAKKQTVNDQAGGRGAPALSDFRLVAGLIILGLLIRAPRLAESLWYDEISAWRDYGMRGAAYALTHYHDPANHIAHTVLTWCSVTGLGGILGHEFALRLPALLFSLAAIGATFSLARCCGGRRVALLSAMCAAIAPVMVLEGAEARGYSMMIFTAATCTRLMIAGLDHGRPRDWIIYALLCALGIWGHMMTVFVPIGHSMWLMWRFVRDRQDRRVVWGMIAIAVAAVIALALYWPVLDDLLKIRGTFSAADGDEPSPFGIEGLHALLQMGGSWYWWAAAPGLALSVIGLIGGLRDKQARRVVALSLLSLPIAVIALTLAGSWMYARFVLFALPGACVLIALGLETVIRFHRATGLAAALIMVAASAADLIARPPKQPLRDAAAYVAEHRSPDDQVLIIGLRHQVMDVYASDLQPAYSFFHGLDLAADLDRAQPRWVIVMYPESVPDDRYALLEINGFVEAAHFRGWVDWTNGDIVIYQR